jgi:hypothetical protein
VPCDHRRWGISDCREARHHGTVREEAWPTVRPASGFGTDYPYRERGAGRVGSGRTIPVVREALVEVTLGPRALKIWDEFILGLDILGAYHKTVDVGRQVLRLGKDELPVREAPTAWVLTQSRPTENLGGRNQGAENINSGTRGCTRTKGGRPAQCDLPDSESGCRRPSSQLGPCSYKEGAAS